MGLTSCIWSTRSFWSKLSKRLRSTKGVLAIEAAIAVPVMILIGFGLAQYMGHLRDVEVTRQAFHNTCLQLTLQDTKTLESPAATSLAMAANLAAADQRVEIHYLYVRENERGDFVAKLYWVREAPLLGYVVTTFVRTGRSIYSANDVGKGAGEVTDQTVYITRTGSKYHLEGCFHLRKSKIETLQSEAENRGYEACAHCILGVALFEKK